MGPDDSISADRFRQVLEISRTLAVTTDLDALLQRIAEGAASLLACERASIFLHDDATDELWTKVALGSREIRVPSRAGIVGWVFQNNEVLHVPRPYEDSRFNPEPDRRSGFVTRNLLTAPMVDLQRRPLGVVQAVNNTRGGGFEATDLALVQLLADQAGVAIQRWRLEKAALLAESLRQEMEIARRVQQAMIPHRPPEVAGLRCAGWNRPASITGGDAYDLWTLADGRLGVLVADASGHGIGPALVVSQVRTLVRSLCDLVDDPLDLFARINARLSTDLAQGQFVTAFLAFVSPDGAVRWTSAGHGPILVQEAPDAAPASLDPPGPPLGVFDPFMAEPVPPMALRRGGQFMVVSDGFFEAFSPSGEQFTMERVIDLLDARGGRTLDGAIDALRSAVEQWQGGREPKDDQTVVLVGRS